MERSWFLCNFVTPPFRFSHHICQAKHKPSISMAPHPINYQSAAPFHKSPQLDWLSLSPTRKMCPRCSTVTESSTNDKQAYSTLTHQSPMFLQFVPHYKAVSLMLVTGVPHVDYSLTKLKQNSSGLVLRRPLVKFQKAS